MLQLYNTNVLPPATTLRSMVQQFDGQLNAKETFLQDQRCKLSEKEKIIISQKTELERLEKKSKTLEYKVTNLLLVCDLSGVFIKSKEV